MKFIVKEYIIIIIIKYSLFVLFVLKLQSSKFIIFHPLSFEQAILRTDNITNFLQLSQEKVKDHKNNKSLFFFPYIKNKLEL